MPRALIVEIFGNAKQFASEMDKAAGKTRQVSKVAKVAGLTVPRLLRKPVRGRVRNDAVGATIRARHARHGSCDRFRRARGKVARAFRAAEVPGKRHSPNGQHPERSQLDR
jgi:hypothetical protein